MMGTWVRVDLVANLFGCKLTWVRVDFGANQLG